MTNLTDLFGDPIAVYSVNDALNDGVLVSAGDLAKELFAVPVVLTTAVWEDCVAWTEDDTSRTAAHGQSETGRLWDVLWMTRCAIQRGIGPEEGKVQLYRIPRDHAADGGEEPAAELVTLRATSSFHDDGSPALVLGFPEED